MKSLTYLSVAEIELAEAATYYDQREAGLGADFLKAVQETIAAIQRSPETWPYYEVPVRSCRVRLFPYRLFYRVLPDRVQIIAVMHLSQKPGYWKNRIK